MVLLDSREGREVNGQSLDHEEGYQVTHSAELVSLISNKGQVSVLGFSQGSQVNHLMDELDANLSVTALVLVKDVVEFVLDLYLEEDYFVEY